MVATGCSRPTLGIDAQGRARIDEVRVHVQLGLGATSATRAALPVHAVNIPREHDQLVLFTPRFGPTTLTPDDGTEVVLSVANVLRPKGSLTTTIVQVKTGVGNAALTAGHMVLSARGAPGRVLKSLRVGETLTLNTVVLGPGSARCGSPSVESVAWGNVTEALGGNYYDADNGVVAAPSATEYPKGAIAAPRTSVGVTADGHVLMVTVDGRQPGYSIGMTLAEMGQLMIQLGAVDAINLDGGGSTVMAIRKPGAAHITVSDRPSDGRERSLTQALTVFSVGAP